MPANEKSRYSLDAPWGRAHEFTPLRSRRASCGIWQAPDHTRWRARGQASFPPKRGSDPLFPPAMGAPRIEKGSPPAKTVSQAVRASPAEPPPAAWSSRWGRVCYGSNNITKDITAAGFLEFIVTTRTHNSNMQQRFGPRGEVRPPTCATQCGPGLHATVALYHRFFLGLVC